MQDYRRLRAWEKAHKLALRIRAETNRFPPTGYSGLKSQMTRAAESIAFNIVEGCGATTQKEMARFLDISIKSSSELQYQLTLAADYQILGRNAPEELTAEAMIRARCFAGCAERF
ncbi:MAG: four helix bundle protein [Gemmatimonadaceae bacterium]